jgi:hypothetical protein
MSDTRVKQGSSMRACMRVCFPQGLPFGCSFLHIHKMVIFFLRGNTSHDGLNMQIKRYFDDVPTGQMIVYPGTLLLGGIEDMWVIGGLFIKE